MGWMKNGMMVGAAATALLMGCGSSQQVRNSASSGSLALSTDDSLLYAADTDNGVVSVIDTKTDSKLYDVQVGTRPMRVTVGTDDTLYVANRGSRSVSVIRKGERAVASEIATGVDPTGLAVSFDGKTLYIVSATAKDTSDYGILQAVDVATLEVKYEKAIGYEPRAIALVSNDKALVTQLRGDKEGGAEVIEVNLKTGEVLNDGQIGIYNQLNKTKVGNPTAAETTAYSTFKTRALTDIVVTPTGDRAFVPGVLAREDAIGRMPSAGGYYSSGGPCNVGSVASAGIVTLDTGANATSPKTDDLTACAQLGTNSSDVDYPPTASGSGSGVASFGGSTGATLPAVQGPSAAVTDGEWLYVVNKETSNVSVMPAWRRQARDGESNDFNRTGSSFRSVVAVNADPNLSSGADGIALSRDGKRAYVYNQFDHKVVRLGNQNIDGSTGGPTSEVVVKATIDLGLKDTLDPQAALGRRFFFDASSTVMSSSLTHVACSTCHLEGRDDGHVWSFPDGKRQTPALVGRGLTKTAPFHWTAQFNTFGDFMSHTVVQRMGGSHTNLAVDSQMVAWLESEPAPENANVRGELTEAQARGKLAFAKAQCGTCHAGEFFTESNVTANVLHNVGVEQGMFDTPSLKGLARSAPYLHDGSAPTLMDRLAADTKVHGDVTVLNSRDKLDLVEYLKTL